MSRSNLVKLDTLLLAKKVSIEGPVAFDISGYNSSFEWSGRVEEKVFFGKFPRSVLQEGKVVLESAKVSCDRECSDKQEDRDFLDRVGSV